MNYPVKHFFKTMQGIPQLQKEKGATIEFLKATLITGFNVRPVTSIHYDASTQIATVTLGVGHGFIEHQIVAISGADQAEYNSEFRVLSVSNEAVTLKMASVPSANQATGSKIEIKTAPVGGWEVVAEDTANFKLCLRRASAQRNNCVYEIEDNNSSGYGFYAQTLVRVCSAFNSFDDRVVELQKYAQPLSSRQNPNADYDFKGFTFIASDKRLFLFSKSYNYPSRKKLNLSFGELDDSTVPADKYHSFLLNDVGVYGQGRNMFQDIFLIARNYKQEPASSSGVYIQCVSSNTLHYPNPQDNGFYINSTPWLVKENNGLRGLMKGTVNPLQNNSVYFDQVITGLPELENIPIIFIEARSDHSNEMVGFRLDTWQ